MNEWTRRRRPASQRTGDMASANTAVAMWRRLRIDASPLLLTPRIRTRHIHERSDLEKEEEGDEKREGENERLMSFLSLKLDTNDG